MELIYNQTLIMIILFQLCIISNNQEWVIEIYHKNVMDIYQKPMCH